MFNLISIKGILTTTYPVPDLLDSKRECFIYVFSHNLLHRAICMHKTYLKIEHTISLIEQVEGPVRPYGT